MIVETPVGPRGTGLVPAPFNTRSIRFRLTADPAVTVDWNAAPTLRPWLTEVEDQGVIGSCVAQTVTSAAELLRRMRGLDYRPLNRNWAYFWGRARSGLLNPDDPGSWQDTGMWAEGGFDAVLHGCPREDLDPYVQDARRRPPAHLDADAPNQDDVLSHRPIFRDDPGGLAGGVVLALTAFMPVAVGLLWHGAYNEPDGAGFLPDLSAVGSLAAHEVLCWKRIPAGVVGPDWYAVCRNSWGQWWTNGRRFPDAELEPGDFLIPGRRFEDGTVIDLRAASFEPVPDPPAPTPQTCAERALALADAMIEDATARRQWSKRAALRQFKARAFTELA